MPTATSNPDPPRLDRCLQCDGDLGAGATRDASGGASGDASGGPSGHCPRCRFPFDANSIAITGAATTSGEFLALVLGWAAAGLLCLSLLPTAFALIIGTAMVVHLGARALLGDARTARRLVIGDAGVALLRNGRRVEPLRWHLFEEARIDLMAEGAPTGPSIALPRWRLTLVNAYKPSVSTYLHRRGTDAPIFAEAIVFTFQAPAALVETLRQRMGRFIETAASGYRALNLRQMHLVPPDPDDVFRVHECPRCAYELRALPARGRCPECGWARSDDMFAIPGRLVGRTPALVMLPAAALILGLVYVLGGYSQIGVPLIGLGLIAIAAHAGLKRMFDHDDRRTVIATRDGLEIWGPRHAPTAFVWSQLPSHRAIQVEFGRWRIAFWDHPKHSIVFSEFFFTWRTFPPGRPVVDVVIRGDELTGRMICDEIERRLNRDGGTIASAPILGQL